MEEMSTFKDRLRQARLLKHMSQIEFAKEIGVSRQAINYYENGARRPDCEILGRIANVLGVSCDWLLLREDLPTHDNTFINSVTGLSHEAINILKEYNEQGSNDSKRQIKALNKLLEAEHETNFLEYLSEYLFYEETTFKLSIVSNDYDDRIRKYTDGYFRRVNLVGIQDALIKVGEEETSNG